MKGSTLAIAGGLGIGLLLVTGAGRARAATPARSQPTGSAPPKKKPRGKNLPQVGLDLVAARSEAPKVASNVIARSYDYDSALMATFQGHAGLAGDGIYGPQTRSALRYFGIQDPPGALFKGTAKEYAPPSSGGVPARLPALAPMGPPLPPMQGGGGSSGGGGASGSWDEPAPDPARRAAQLAAGGQGTPAAQQPSPDDDDDGGAPSTTLSAPTPSNLDLARREAPSVAKHITSKRQNYSRQMVSDFQRHAGLVPDGAYGPVTRSALAYFGVSNPPAAISKSKNPNATYQPPT